MSGLYESNHRLVEINEKLSELDQSIGTLDKEFDNLNKNIDNLEKDTSSKGPSIPEMEDQIDIIHAQQIAQNQADLVQEESRFEDYKSNVASGTNALASIKNPENIKNVKSKLENFHTPSSPEAFSDSNLEDDEYLVNPSSDLDKPVKNIWNKNSSLNRSNSGNRVANIISEPSKGRTLFINLFDSFYSSEFNNLSGSEKHIPFSYHTNIVRDIVRSGAHKPIFIEIDRDKSVQSYDFGLTYITLRENLSEVKDNGGYLNTSDRTLGFMANAYVKRYHGSIILTGCKVGETFGIKSIIYNSDEDVVDHNKYLENGLSPEFKLRFALDDSKKKIMIWLEKIKPYRLSWFDISGLKLDGANKNLYSMIIRDIAELNTPHQPKYTATRTNNILPWLETKQGKKASNIILSALNSVDLDNLLDIIGNSNVDDTGDETYLLPHYSINLSLKDNSYKPKSSFVTKVEKDFTNVDALPYKDLDIIPDSNSMIQLNNMGLTGVNTIVPKNNKIIITNSKVDPVNGIMRSVYEPKDAVELVKTILSDYVFNNQTLVYNLKINLTTRNFHEVGANTKIPDFVINEMGFIKNVEGVNSFSYICDVMDPRILSKLTAPTTVSELKTLIENTHSYKEFDSYSGSNVVEVVSASKIPMNIIGKNVTYPVGIFSKTSDIPSELDMNSFDGISTFFKGYFQIILEIFQANGNMRETDIECLSTSETVFNATNPLDSDGVEYEGKITRCEITT